MQKKINHQARIGIPDSFLSAAGINKDSVVDVLLDGSDIIIRRLGYTNKVLSEKDINTFRNLYNRLTISFDLTEEEALLFYKIIKD